MATSQGKSVKKIIYTWGGWKKPLAAALGKNSCVEK
jgi:hypothetical protein